MKVLHITNGDAAAVKIRESGAGEEVLPWRDVLHEGPVPGGLSLEELSDVRARFLAGCQWGGPLDRLTAEFRSRDETLGGFRQYDEVVLWFEHDLYDQLQLLQVLDWLRRRDAGRTRLSLICIGSLPGVERFHGLAQLGREQLQGLHGTRHEIDAAQLDLAHQGWEAFSCNHPGKLEALFDLDLSALCYLGPALGRHLEQYPAVEDGLSRSERQLLEALVAGPCRLDTAYRVSQIEREEAPFMADWPFLLHMAALAEGRSPLLRFTDGERCVPARGSLQEPAYWGREIEITEAGRRVLAREADCVGVRGIDRWLGGVHLVGQTVSWRWSTRRRKLVVSAG